MALLSRVAMPWRRKEKASQKLYGAIVAQARLPVFYQDFGVPDTLEGRYVVLSLNLFTVLHRLKGEGARAQVLSQELADRFKDDMETVLRELGVSDLRIPKKMRALAASSAALLQAYERAFAEGEGALAKTIEEALPLEGEAAKAAATHLAHYLRESVRSLAGVTCTAVYGGALNFPKVSAARREERMSKQNEHLPLSRPVKVDEIREGASGSLEATPAEMTAIATLLDLRGLEGLAMTFRVFHAGAGRLRLKGELKAKVTQTCVVSLEPVQSEIDVPVETEFWPAEMIAAHEERGEEQGSATLSDWPEPISDGRIDLGPLVYETLATSLDPYPKKEGVSFEWSQGGEEPRSETRRGPFAALEALKRR